ncbi:MAG: NAD(P)/FAD-dependent oxidoreductase [Brevefilum sp.]|nr:NAD(P)/FAD-dependent oxidoreductase [Brevefilum sp.]
MIYDAIVVGAGVSGLISAAFLAKYGRSTLLLEKEPHCGGLVNSFTRDGFTFDGGIRALDNAGALFPMLRNLGIEIEFVKNHVSLGIEDQIIRVDSDLALREYEKILNNLYPESREDITTITKDIKKIMDLMDVQYGIDNPLFLDIKADRDYFIKEVFPWMFKFAITAPKIKGKNLPAIPYLQQFTKNSALIDIISQHFFIDTPAYFALSYFKLFQDYYYPKGGTGVFIEKLTDFILQHGGEIRTSTAVTSIDLEKKTVTTMDGDVFEYRQLLWAADQKALYRSINIEGLNDQKLIDVVGEKQNFLADKTGNDSIFTLFVSTNLDKSYFESIATGHFFYTPSRKGQSKAGPIPLGGTWEEVKVWLESLCALTTYEIAIPVLRDSALAPEGKAGLIISVLFDYQLSKYIADQGWDEQFRAYSSELMINTLDASIYPGLAKSVINSFTSTPLSIKKITGNTHGAITGWSFTNNPVPAESRLVKIANAVKTPLPDVHQAGQWTYSPSGLPVSLITGKLAADRINKRLK